MNGNVNQVVDSTTSTTVNYTYDNLNRLDTAATASTAWGLSFTYDDFGNRTAQSVTKGSAPTSSLSISTANNRILTSGFSYDNNGNLTAMPGSTLTYDIENRITQITGSFGTDQYKYGPDNNRWYKYRVNGSLPNEFYYFYGAFGELLGVYSPYDDGYSHGYRTIGLNTYFAGRQIRAKQTDNGSLSDAAVVVDRLGSVRKRVNVYTVTPTVNQTYLNYPFGEDQGSSANNREKYATYFRDKDTGLDYARNRYYASTMGRFLTPDPYRGSAKPNSPQTWNRYPYASSMPVTLVDPSGLIEMSYIGPEGGGGGLGPFDPYGGCVGAGGDPTDDEAAPLDPCRSGNYGHYNRSPESGSPRGGGGGGGNPPQASPSPSPTPDELDRLKMQKNLYDQCISKAKSVFEDATIGLFDPREYILTGLNRREEKMGLRPWQLCQITLSRVVMD
ncbi:MAG: RHS repeat-associated core domain-containing protein [Terriglobia bacterium]